ncbi:hypothetical protein LSTR_LSTR010522 [Laodelphax striatellus]|uniref:Uncharacterized protein n=1 Tax=Laodelphax striatellus TaxID=195883 RepID=A0A482X215_LAOST|nr:hypothetical protein LSTR_LSTR010522 [Laodelphax striatellus]
MSKVDDPKTLRALEAGQNILDFLSSRPVRELDDPIKNKIHSAAISCELLQSRIFNSRSSELDKVWEGLSMQECMFSKYIRHYKDIDQLGCAICKDMFPCTQGALRKHVESGVHIKKYLNIVSSEFNDYWIDEGTMLKYGKFVNFDGLNGKIFCKVCFIEVEKDKLELLKHFKENRHKESFKDIVYAITGSKCGNESDDFLSSYSSRKNQHNAGHSSSSSCSKRTPPPCASSSSSPTNNSGVPRKKKSFTQKIVEARLNETAKEDRGGMLNSKASQSSSSRGSRSSCSDLPNEEEAGNFHPGRRSFQPRRILFDNIRKASDVHRMHFVACSIEDTNLIVPIGLEGVPSHTQNRDIERACNFLGDVVRVERQNIKENVIIYMVLSKQYKNVFGRGWEVQVGWTKYKILNPFLYS